VACATSYFFFSSRRRHTRSKRDWSSDVCSSDLAEYESAKKSPVVAWVLWIFLGGIGGHRYYLGDIGYGIAMTLFTWMTFGLWWRSEERRVGKERRAGWEGRDVRRERRKLSG